MKKVLTALAAVACGAAFADGVTSDVVGYSTDTTAANNNFLAVPFNLVGYNTADIQQLKLGDGGVGTIGWGEEIFTVWSGVPTVVDGSEYIYIDPSLDPEGKATDYYWGDGSYSKAAFSIAAGQGIVVNCNADGLSLTTSGAVSSNKVEFTSVANNNFAGNSFAAPIDIQAIKISDDVGNIGWGEEIFTIWEGVPTVKDGSEFIYIDPSLDPEGKSTDYYWGDGSYKKTTYSIPAGQGVVINCAEGLKISIAAPYSL